LWVVLSKGQVACDLAFFFGVIFRREWDFASTELILRHEW